MRAADQQLEHARALLASFPGAVEKAMARALNRAAAAGREAAVSSISERYAVRASDVRDKITVTAASAENLNVAVVARSQSLALGYFPHSPLDVGTGGPGKPGLRAEVLRGQERSIKDAFVATINGKPRIMMRTGGTTKSGRTAIKSVYTVPFASMLGATSVREAVEGRATAVLDAQLEREIDRELRGSE